MLEKKRRKEKSEDFRNDRAWAGGGVIEHSIRVV